MLAYVFWHQPGDAVDRIDYEGRAAGIHDALGALGDLNERAVDTQHRSQHDRVAAGTAWGWGGIYELVQGEPQIPAGTEWFDKPRGEPSEGFLASRAEAPIWRRQMMLGPAPEFCVATAATPARIAI